MSRPRGDNLRRQVALATLAKGVADHPGEQAGPERMSSSEALMLLEAELEVADLATEDLRALQRVTEEALRHLTRFRETHPLPLVRVDRQLQVLDLNPAGRSLFRLGPAEPLPGPLLRRALSGEDAVRLRDVLTNATADGAAGPGAGVLGLTVSEGCQVHAEFLMVPRMPSDAEAWTLVLVPRPVQLPEATLMASVLEADDEAVCVTAASGEFLLANPGFATLVGRPLSAILGRSWLDLLPLEEAVHHVSLDRQVLNTGLRLERRERRQVSEDRPSRELHTVKLPLHDPEGRFIGVTTRSRDVTGDAEAAAARELSELVFQHSSDAIAVTDVRLRLQRVNPAFERIVGFAASDLLGVRLDLLGTPEDSLPLRDMRADLELRGFWAGELPLCAADGRELVLWCSLARMSDASGVAIGYVAVHTDLTALRAVHAENRKLAQFDNLTGLPNRVTLMKELEESLRSAARQGEPFSVAFLDIDHFKAVNDTLGHSAGDSLLRLAAERLRSHLRPQDIISRIGGDEFVVLMPRVDTDAALAIMERIRDGFQTPLDLQDYSAYRCTLSIGIASFPRHGETAEELLRLADTAMYDAKSSGRNGVSIYEVSMGEEISKAFQIRNAVLTAIENEELELYFQPLFRLRDRQVVGAEVLVRWNRPGHGTVPPGEFLPAMELAGLMPALDRWVFHNAIRTGAFWEDEGLLHPKWVLSINQTSISINQTTWIEECSRALDEFDFVRDSAGALPIALQVELTEDHLAEPIPIVLSNMRRLREMGLSLAIDDFGTGYSNLAYLHTLPATTLKIDRKFVSALDHDEGAGVVIEAMILMGRRLGYSILAEGVETEAQASRLQELGCELGQGYLVAPPLPADLFRERFLDPPAAPP